MREFGVVTLVQALLTLWSLHPPFTAMSQRGLRCPAGVVQSVPGVKVEPWMKKFLHFFGNPCCHARMDGPSVNNNTNNWKSQNYLGFVSGFVADVEECATKCKLLLKINRSINPLESSIWGVHFCRKTECLQGGENKNLQDWEIFPSNIHGFSVYTHYTSTCSQSIPIINWFPLF